MIRVFLRKDWTRLRRDPATVLLLLALPVAIALITRTVFSPGDQPVKFVIPMAFVDEDLTPLTGFLQGALANEQVKQIFTVRTTDRDRAMTAVRENEVAGVLIVPKGFTDAYLANRPCNLQLVTNPARPISSNILKQSFSILVELLDGIRELFPNLLSMTRGQQTQEAFRLVSQAANRLAGLAPLVFQFPFQFETEKVPEQTKTERPSAGTKWTLAFIPGLGFLVALFVVASVFRRFSDELHRGLVHRVLVTPANGTTMLIGLLLYAFLLVIGMQVVLWGITLSLFRIPVYHPARLLNGLIQMGLLATLLNGFLYAMPLKARTLEVLTSIVTLTVALLSGLLVSPLFMPEGIRKLVSISPFYQPVASMIDACLTNPGPVNWGREGMQLLVIIGLLILASILFRLKITRIVHGEKLGGTP